jgi:hypothetical protein
MNRPTAQRRIEQAAEVKQGRSSAAFLFLSLVLLYAQEEACQAFHGGIEADCHFFVLNF